MIENIDEIVAKENEQIKGTLYLNVLHAKKIVHENKKPNDIDSCIKLTIPTVKEIKTSETKQTKNTETPIFNFKKELKLALKKDVSRKRKRLF